MVNCIVTGAAGRMGRRIVDILLETAGTDVACATERCRTNSLPRGDRVDGAIDEPHPYPVNESRLTRRRPKITDDVTWFSLICHIRI